MCALIVDAAREGLASHASYRSLERPSSDTPGGVLLERPPSIRQQHRALLDIGAGGHASPKARPLLDPQASGALSALF